MNTQQAQSAVSISAFVVAAIYAYRRLVETSTTAKPAASTGHFVIGFGFTYVTLAVAAQAAPELGGMFAILVATGDVLTNGKALTGDIGTNLKRTSSTTTPAGSTATGSTAATAVAETPETPGGN